MHFREFVRTNLHRGETPQYYVNIYMAAFPGRVAPLLEELLR